MKEKKDNVINVQFKRRLSGKVIGIILGIFLVGVILLLSCFKIHTIEVTGNVHYTEDQIKDYVLSEGYINNSVLLMIKNKIRPISDIPFIAKIDIEYNGPHKVVVTVYEKALAGCVEYMNQYIYFDQDGYVLEISATKLEDTPCITGMHFDSMELHEKLPIEDKKRFKTILTLTQLIQKYNVHIDSIQFTSDEEIVLQYEDIKIELGDGSNIEEQLIDLDRMLEPLKGKKGTLDLKNFDTAVGTASFKIQDSSAATTENTSENEGNTTEPEQTTPSAENITETTTENTVENTQQTPDTEVQN